MNLFQRKQVWLPTWRGWLLLCVLGLAIATGLLFGTVGFLAPNRPLHARILVVEGWLPDFALGEAQKIVAAQGYERVLVTGAPIEQGFPLSEHRDYATLGSRILEKLGVPKEKLVPLSCPKVPRNRTYATALRAGEWMQANAPGQPVDVLTLGVHARRTWMLYDMAFGDRHEIGIHAVPDRSYDQRWWWTTSNGFRIVSGEALAYVYARCFFHPGRSRRDTSELDILPGKENEAR